MGARAALRKRFARLFSAWRETAHPSPPPRIVGSINLSPDGANLAAASYGRLKSAGPRRLAGRVSARSVRGGCARCEAFYPIAAGENVRALCPVGWGLTKTQSKQWSGFAAAYLNARAIPGVSFLPVSYVAAGDKLYPFAGQRVEGVEILLHDRARLDAPELGVEAVAALWKLYGTAFQIDRVDRLLHNRPVLDQIKAGVDPRRIAASWQPALIRFKAQRARYLLY